VTPTIHFTFTWSLSSFGDQTMH